MTIEYILGIGAIGTLLGMVVIVRKNLSLFFVQKEGEKNNFIIKIKEKIKNELGLKNICYEDYLQKILAKIHLLNLKTENKTRNWLESLRKKANEKKHFPKDNYWEELKKAKEGKE